MIPSTTERTLDELMDLAYRVVIYRDGDYWAAEFPELPGLVAGHETWDGLGDAIDDAKRTYFEAALTAGKPIPEPRSSGRRYSGKLLVRMPPTLHRRLAECAESEGVSINQLAVTALARGV